VTSRREAIRMSSAELADLLETELYGVLATNGANGYPHQTNIVFLLLSPGEIAMIAFRKAQKVINLQRDPRCTFLVERTHPYHEIRGTLLRGVAHIDDDFESVKSMQRRILDASADREGLDALPSVDLEAIAHKRVVLRLRIEKAVTWDHRKLGGTY
jgi:Pyridoxamine 5'-phosphate oxidase